MPDIRIRRQIARRAAQLMYARDESEYFTAKRKAARELGLNFKYSPRDLPSNAEIRDEIQLYAQLIEGDTRYRTLNDMRIDALRLMRKLERFCPKLIGSVLTGHIREGSDVDIHLFTDSHSAVTCQLDDEGLAHTIEHKRVIKHNEERIFTHIHVADRFEIELAVYAANQVNYPFKSSITGKLIESATVPELETLLRETNPGMDLEEAVERLSDQMDAVELYRMLLAPLENVKQAATHHPEGDALYHSLQVFELAARERPWDEEFLLAALLHDVGKAIDRHDHVDAGLDALDGALTARTSFLIKHHMEAHAYRDQTLGGKARRRLAESEWIEDLLLLSELDQAGRQRGAQVCSLDEALQYIDELSEQAW
jgi:hypothetical protein